MAGVRQGTGLLVVVATFLAGLAGAWLGLRATVGQGAAEPPGWLVVGFALAGLIFVVVAILALVHVLRYEGLEAHQRLLLCLALVIVPGGGVAYFVIGPQRVTDWVAQAI